MPVRVSKRTASLSALMIVVAVAALVFSKGREYVPVPSRAVQGGDAVLYEAADASDDLAVRVGPNRFSVAAVARNDRDGTLHVEDGRGALAKGLPFTPTAVVAGQAGWLDVANIYLNPADPARFDVIELRVFDHTTRRLLTNRNGTGASYYPSSPPVVQVRALGERLPGSLDVWFRVASHEAGAPIVALKAEAGSSATIARGTLSVRDVRRGSPSYSTTYSADTGQTEYHWRSSPDSVTEGVCTAVFDWEGEQAQEKFQICAVGRDGQKVGAVGRDGRKVFPSVPHFVRFDANRTSQAISFKIAEADLSHFELRPFGDRRTFYFENVVLPKVSAQPFRQPPSAHLPVDGREVERTFSEFSPIRVRLSLRRGRCCQGISSDGFQAPPTPVERLDSEFTVFLSVEGVAGNIWELAYTDRDGQPIDVQSGGRTTRYRSSSASGHHEAAMFQIPLDRIGAVEVRLAP